MTLRETLTGPERDEIVRLLDMILTDVLHNQRSVNRTVIALQQVVEAALAQDPNFMNELRVAAGA